MRRILVFIPRLTSEHRAQIESAAHNHGYDVLFCDDRDQAEAAAPQAEIIFSHSRTLPGRAPHLKWLCIPNAGADPYLSDDMYADPAAMLSNSSGAYGVTIAEHIIMVTLTMMRRQAEYDNAVRDRQWIGGLSIRSIQGCSVTMLGAGDIGRETAMRMKAFHPKRLVAVNRSGRSAGEMFDETLSISALDEILPHTDLLVMSLPGTPHTQCVMDERRLMLLPEDAFLVNVGRGSAIDESALIRVMQSGRLSGAALDVFTQEPLPADDPLWGCPRLLITPHIAGNMTLKYTVDRIVELFLEDLENYCASRPLKRHVDRNKGY